MKRQTRIRLDLAAINLSFLLNYSAFYSMQGLQSSLNKSIGTQSLCALCISAAISAMFVPPISISMLGERRSMSFGTLTYPLFTLANCYPQPYTLIPTAIILGCGAAISWSAVLGYIRTKSAEYALIDGSDKDAKTTHVFGVFMAFISTSLLIGNVTSSMIFQSISTEMGGNFPLTNISAETVSRERWNVTENTKPISNLHCGMQNCDYDAQNQTETPEDVEQTITNSPVVYILFGVFASLQTAAALIQLFVLTELREVSNSKQTKKDSITPMITDDQAVKQVSTQIVAKQMMATIKLNISNKIARLLIPIALDIGIVEGFVMGQLTRDWMTCYMGIQYVGYGVSVFGIGSIVASYGCGILSYHLRRQTMLLAILILETALGLYLLFWKPNTATDSWIFYLTFGVYGIIFTSRKTLINASYTIFFPNDTEAASPSSTIWGSTGGAVAFAISSIICNRIYVIIMLVLASAATGMFTYAERIRAKSSRKNSDEIRTVGMEHG